MGLYGPGLDLSSPEICINPNCSQSETINIFLSNFTCGSNSSLDYVELNNNLTLTFNITQFLNSVLSPSCGFYNLVQDSQAVFASLPALSTNIRINVVQGTEAPPFCNTTCGTENIVTLNLFVPDICISSCFCNPSSSQAKNTVLTSTRSPTTFSESICVNSASLIELGVIAPYQNWQLLSFLDGSRSVFENKNINNKRGTQLNGTGSIGPNGDASGSFQYWTTSAFTTVGFSLYNPVTNTSISLPNTAVLASQSSTVDLAGGVCDSDSCCQMVIDCIQSFSLIQSFPNLISNSIGATWPAGSDILCPYPVCSWAFTYNSTANLCLQTNPPPNTTVLEHQPYQSLSDCSRDYSRSPNSYCLEPLVLGYRTCKHDAGLP